MRVCVLLLVSMAANLAWADIDCPDTFLVNDPIVVTVTPTAIPEGAKLRGSFSVSGAKYIQVGENSFHIWAAPGPHVLRASGVWALTKDIQVDGQSLPVLVDFGSYGYEKAITVGEGPSPVPPPDPPLPGTRKAVILEESKDKTSAQALLWAQLLKVYKPEQLQILDDDLPQAAKYLSLSKLSARPVLLVLTEQGALIREVSVPSSVDGVRQEIER